MPWQWAIGDEAAYWTERPRRGRAGSIDVGPEARRIGDWGAGGDQAQVVDPDPWSDPDP